MATNKITTPFEDTRIPDDDTPPGWNPKQPEGDFANLAKKYDIFSELESDSDQLDINANDLMKEVDNLVNKDVEIINKNLTFGLIFKSIKHSLKEYKTTSILFRTYSKAYMDIGDEENTVKVLDILREILKERKESIDSVISNLIKIQKLTNDRIKIDKADSDVDVDDLMSPEEI